MELKVDYHIHTTYSDGKSEPVDVVKMYHDNEYDVISITDHDGIGGINEAMIAGKALNMTVVPGIEFSSGYMYNGRERGVHLLGYQFDVNNEALNREIDTIRKNRDDRNRRLIKYINEKGYDITYEEVCSKVKHDFIGKPNIARVLIEKGYFSSEKEAFDNLLETKEINQIPKVRISTERAIEVILEAKGIPVLAHPVELDFFGKTSEEKYWEELDSFVKYLKGIGLKGLECYQPYKQSEYESGRYVELANKYHLHITGGTDFHGSSFTDREKR